MDNKTLDIKNMLKQQCNHWFSEYKKLEKIKDKNSENLMIEALGCAKGNLCILKELDEENVDIYENFIFDINCKLEEIYENQIKIKSNSTSFLYKKYMNNSILH